MPRPIKTLCITEDADRPTTATFIGLAQAGVDVTVMCPAASDRRAALVEAGVRVLDLPVRKRVTAPVLPSCARSLRAAATTSCTSSATKPCRTV